MAVADLVISIPQRCPHNKFSAEVKPTSHGGVVGGIVCPVEEYSDLGQGYPVANAMQVLRPRQYHFS